MTLSKNDVTAVADAAREEFKKQIHSVTLDPILEPFDKNTKEDILKLYLLAATHGAERMREKADERIVALEVQVSELIDERNETKDEKEKAEEDLGKTEDKLYEAEAQLENAPTVENLADQQKAEIAKRLVANLTIEQMEALEVNAFNMVKIHGGRYSIPADTIVHHSLQQLVDTQH